MLTATLAASCTSTANEHHAKSELGASHAPSWCASVDVALGRSAGQSAFRCLPIPNYLVTGFYGTAQNPERSDFLNGCFAPGSNAAQRLRLAIRPAGKLELALAAEQGQSRAGSLNLSFLGPWAPEVRAASERQASYRIRVELEDAEIRVLASVPEILAQEYEAADTDLEQRESLERCLSSLCATGPAESLVYTTKVLAAVPMVRIQRQNTARESGKLVLASSAAFVVEDASSSASELVIRGKEKLNVAAELEPARAAFERAGTCELVRRTRARRTVTTALRELGLQTLAGRDLPSVITEAARLRGLVAHESGFSNHEQGDLLSLLEALQASARNLTAAEPSSVCATIDLLRGVLTGAGKDNRLHDTLTEVAEPLQRRLLDAANQRSLPCAEPAWFEDGDGDGYGNAKVRVHKPAQPQGFVANALDCFDQNADAHPGQTKHFARHRGDGSYDYDCDGRDSLQKDLLAGGCRVITRFGIPIRCWAEIGWQNKLPQCGETGRWLADCQIGGFSCDEPEERLERQACR